LESAVDALKHGREPSLEDLTSNQTEVELRMPALLPDDYIPDVNTRLSFYKRIPMGGWYPLAFALMFSAIAVKLTAKVARKQRRSTRALA